MPLRCLTAGRMTMKATILHQNSPVPTPGLDLDFFGEWVDNQDRLTGEIVRVWRPYDPWEMSPDNPSTKPNESVRLDIVPCIARGIVDGGIRVAGTTERFGDSYENVDFVKMWVPASVIISKRDRVTNIMDANGRLRWVDEEFVDPREVSVPQATVFNVNGVTPLFNAFNTMTEQFVLLEKVSGASE